MELVSSLITFFFLATLKISSFFKLNIVCIPGGLNTKSAFFVVGLVPPILIYKPAKELCQSNSMVSESCGNQIS